MFLYSASLEKHMEAYAREVKMQELNELRQLAANKITRQSELFNISQFENMQKIQALLSQPVREVEREVAEPVRSVSQKKLTVDTSTPKSQKASPKKSPLIVDLENSPLYKSRASSIASPTSSFATTVTSTTAQATSDLGKPKDTRGMAKQYKKKTDLESEIKKIIGDLNIKDVEKTKLVHDMGGLKRDELETFRKNLETDYGATNSSAFNLGSGLKGRGLRKGLRKARR